MHHSFRIPTFSFIVQKQEPLGEWWIAIFNFYFLVTSNNFYSGMEKRFLSHLIGSTLIAPEDSIEDQDHCHVVLRNTWFGST
jgi:hypothetical protein